MFYEIAVIGSPLLLTYTSDKNIKKGSVVEISLRGRNKRGVVLQEVSKPEYECKEIESITQYIYSPFQLQLASFIATYYVTTHGEAFSIITPFKKDQKISDPPKPLKKVELSPKQQEALEFLKKKKTALLFGDTGSGKTEIYMRYFQETIEQKKRAIFLMPEISLTPQMEERLRSYFGDAVVIWHSKLTKKRRQEALEKIYSGEATIIAGPRSALFLPVADLGLIVVDEEHDDSYKSQSNPRINARDIALYIAKSQNIPVILGSATPSATSYHKLPSFRLKGTYFASGTKEVLIDSAEGASPLVLQELEEVLRNKKQALIFLPTRGHFKYLICNSCGQAVKCPYCDVGMSVHFDRRALVCHYCNFAVRIPSSCPNCASTELEANRVGTKEIVEELQLIFPHAKIEKFDKDAITTHSKLIKTLKAFSKKEIDILVGTQMLAKGHDYPDVALSVVMGIDYLLAMADYRARERAMALYVQVAGRAGRRDRAKVILQTKNREFFQSFSDYEEFIRFELDARKDLYPPFVRLARILFAHKNEQRAKETMEQALTCLQTHNVEIVGYGKSAIEKIASKYRYHILLRSTSAKKLLQALHACKNELAQIDIDPISFA